VLVVFVLVLSAATGVLAQERAGSPHVADRKFWAVAAALNTAMVLDTRSTFDVVRVCDTCREANPVVAPFVRRGPAITFTAGEVFDAGVMSLAAKMKASDRPWVRRTWWAVPVALTVGHSIAYRHNRGLLP
jgi:hypothetical protein